MIIENAINIYTDGSSFSSPRLGGIGIRWVIINSLGQEEVEVISDALNMGCEGMSLNDVNRQKC